MSMGASVVSAYLAAYPTAQENHVRRVVSVVGCWKGSDLVYDLIKRNYAQNAPDLLYNGILAEMVGKPWGTAVNLALRLFSKKSLRSLIDEALGVFTEEVLLNAPSLCALMPDRKYEEIRSMIPRESVRRETDAYYAAQSTLKERMETLERQGIAFSFIAGYGLPYGAVTDDYKVFGFMRSAATTNSDEIINVESTVPGAVSVAHNGVFADPADRALSPDGSVDISGAYYKDSAWLFRGQKHELENNNVAMALAIHLALGDIKTVRDCDDPAGAIYFPQFNGARDLKLLKRDQLPVLEAYLANGGSLTPAQQTLYDEILAMINRTVIDETAEKQLMDRFADMLAALGLLEAPATPSPAEGIVNGISDGVNDAVDRVVGSKGYLDLPDGGC